MTEPLEVEYDGPVLVLTMSRPAKRNALDLALIEALRRAFDAYVADPNLRCAVLTGAPPAFCAGLDLKSFAAPDSPRHLATHLINTIPTLGKPVIAAVNGAAYTGGLELALSCDFILASESARFADTHAKIGAVSGSGMGSRLPHVVGARMAKQMMLSCLPIDAETALRIGLANEVVPDAALLARALELARAIATYDPQLVAMTRNVIDRGAETTLAGALQIEQEALARHRQQRRTSWSA